MDKVFKIKELEHIKLLSDPLKLRLLKCFAQAKTTKQVANELGESVTKLYRHVDALHEAGLLTIKGQTKKRGTLERTFQAAAERFEMDSALFNDHEEAVTESGKMIRDIFRTTEQDILSYPPKNASEAEQTMVCRVQVKMTKQRADELRQKLNEWLASVADEEAEDEAAAEDHAALIAFYPVRSKKE